MSLSPTPRYVLGLDIGLNAVGSAWVDLESGEIVAGVSAFSAGVEELDDWRGNPTNLRRRQARRARLTFARRSKRKRLLRLSLIQNGLLPETEQDFHALLMNTDPWDLRVRGLTEALTPHEFGRVLMHLGKRRGARLQGVPIPGDAGIGGEEGTGATDPDEGRLKGAIEEVRIRMKSMAAPTFGAFISRVRTERTFQILTQDRRRPDRQKGPREYRNAIRNRAGSYEYCADRAMIREEFGLLWDAQRELSPALRTILTDDLRRTLDDESADAMWLNKGLLAGQRRPSWDAGTLWRCVLHPTDRCVPHADRYASRYRVVEMVNGLRIQERGREERPLTSEERQRVIDYLSGPLGMVTPPPRAGRKQEPRPKTTVNILDLRSVLGWGRPSPTSRRRFNIESDPERTIPTDWFNREVVHRALTVDRWSELSERQRDDLNRVLLRFDPKDPDHPQRIRNAIAKTADFTEDEVYRLIAVWARRPNIEKRLNLSRRAVRNLLSVMDQLEPCSDGAREGESPWISPIGARRLIAADPDFRDVTSGSPLDESTRQRYLTGVKNDRMKRRRPLQSEDGTPILTPEGETLFEPLPAPILGNPVVRRSIHEVRRHIVAHLRRAKCRPDLVVIDPSREARVGKEKADRLLALDRLRNRIRGDIVAGFGIGALPPVRQRAIKQRVVLAAQQGLVCPLCGEGGLTMEMAASGEGCDTAHIIPREAGGHDGFANLILCHTRCGEALGRLTPREFWDRGVGFEEGMRWVERIYSQERISRSQIRGATGLDLWRCYFDRVDDQRKAELFRKSLAEVQAMENQRGAATTYATRQIMVYLSDALFEGKGLLELREPGVRQSSEQKVFVTDGLWTNRLRHEWDLIYDPHRGDSKTEDPAEVEVRREKNRGDYRQRSLNAAIAALAGREVRLRWEAREKAADHAGVRTRDESEIRNWRRRHPLPFPGVFAECSRAEFRSRVRRAVYGERDVEPGHPVAHRPSKRKLVGALHEETLFGPVLDDAGELTGLYTGRRPVDTLNPNHLRLPVEETLAQAIDRFAERRQKRDGLSRSEARRWARAFVKSSAYTPQVVDPSPGNSGLVRDPSLRMRIRECLREQGIDPDSFGAAEIQRLARDGSIAHRSGVPIRTVVLIRTMDNPAIIPRSKQEYGTGKVVVDPTSRPRAYQGGNNHHIEVRVDEDGEWEGEVVSAFEASRRNAARLRAIREARIPDSREMRKLPARDRQNLRSLIAEIERRYAIVDRLDDPDKGGRFVMSLSEGEMVLMKHPKTGKVDFFVVVKLKQDGRIYLSPHWDARAATGRRDELDRKVPGSVRETLDIRPSKFEELAPMTLIPHILKVQIDPLGTVTVAARD